MGRANINTKPFTYFLQNDSYHRFLSRRNILNRPRKIMGFLVFRVTVLRTRLELVSIHHLLPLVEWFNVPALVAITVDSVVLLLATVDICRRPGPSLRFTCRAGI